MSTLRRAVKSARSRALSVNVAKRGGELDPRRPEQHPLARPRQVRDPGRATRATAQIGREREREAEEGVMIQNKV